MPSGALARQRGWIWTEQRVTTDGIVVGRTENALTRISSRRVCGAVMRRSVGEVVLREACPDLGFCRMTALGTGFQARALLGSAFPRTIHDFLARDLERVHSWLRRADAGRGNAQLHVTDGDDCRKFHVDYYRLRLIVTYVGPGTELVPESALNRLAIWTGGDDVALANRSIVRAEGAIVRAHTGDVVLLKGERWAPGLAAVHRSPPIERSGLRRLILKLTVD
jgi:hypothetical protein